jgi:tetratricopeptide (TPR) repeat protein
VFRDQKGVDTVEEVFDPAGRRVLRVDSALGAYGREPIWILAEHTGVFRLVVTPLLRAVRGSYALRVEEIRRGGPRDRTRARAAQIHASSRNFEELTTPRAREESLRLMGRAAALWAETRDPRDEALVLFDIGRAHRFHGDLRQSIEVLRKAEQRAGIAGDRQLEARLMGVLGLCLSFVGDPAAFEMFAQSTALAHTSGDLQQESASLHGQAYSRWSTAAYEEALELDRRSLAIARSREDREVAAWELWGLGLTDLSLGELDRSVDESAEALALWRDLKDLYGESSTLQNLGFAYWLLGRSAQALEAYRQALPLTRRLGNQQGEALALNNIGLAETDLGDPASAVPTLRDSVDLFRRVGSKHGEALALGTSATPWSVSSGPRGPRAIPRERGSGEGGVDAAAEANALASLAQLESRSGDLDAARGHVTSALAILESQRGSLAETRLKSSFLAARQDFYAIALDIQLRLHAREPGEGHDAEGFRISERGRARALAEAIVEARLDLSGDLPEDVRRRERELGAELDRLQKELAARRPRRRRRPNAEEKWTACSRTCAEGRLAMPRFGTRMPSRTRTRSRSWEGGPRWSPTRCRSILQPCSS